MLYVGFPGASEVKASAWNAGDLGSIPGLGKIPWRRKWLLTPVLLPGESHGGRSLVGYSPWCHKESDTTERLHYIIFQMVINIASILFALFAFLINDFVCKFYL